MKKEELLDLDFYPEGSKISEAMHDSLVDKPHDQASQDVNSGPGDNPSGKSAQSGKKLQEQFNGQSLAVKAKIDQSVLESQHQIQVSPRFPQKPPLGAVRLIDGLYLGDIYASRDFNFLSLNKIHHVVNCAGKEI